MKTISYNDPYELPVFIQIEDDDEEGLEEVINFLNDNAKLVKNADRRERYHTACHLEGLTYEGMEYAAKADKHSWEDDERIIDEWLHKNLTEVQYRRFRLFMEGLSIRDVAKQEGIDYSSANESIKAAKKKLQKIWKNTPSKYPLKSP